MLTVRVSLNIKDQHDGEHLRLIMVAVIKLDETFEATVALCYLFVLLFSCGMLFVYVCSVYVHMFVLTLSLIPCCCFLARPL